MLGKQFTNGQETLRVVAECGWSGLKKDQQRAYSAANPWLHDSDKRRCQFVITRGPHGTTAQEKVEFFHAFREVDHSATSNPAA